MNPGDVFNPWFGECGFYPGDIVCKQSSKTLSQGQKLLYTRLVRYAGRDGRCFPSQERLADELGISERQAQRDIYRLEALKLIECQPRDGRRGNTYVFLWNSIFDAVDRTPMSAQTGKNEPADSDLTRRACRLNESLTRQPCRLKPEQEPNLTRHIGDLRRHAGQFETTYASSYLISKPSEKQSSSSPTPSDGGREDEEEINSLETGERESEDVSDLVAFMAETLEASTGKPVAVHPRDAQRARDKAPSWTIAEIAEGLRQFASTGKPQNVRWFPKVVMDVYDRLDKKPPVAPKIGSAGRIQEWQGFKCEHGHSIRYSNAGRILTECRICESEFGNHSLNEEGYPRVMM